MRQFKLLFLVGILFFANLNSFAQLQKNISTGLDSIINHLPTKGPGGVLIIAKDGQQIYHREFGYANLQHQVPITNETIFGAASVSKQFTATAALILVDRGLLSLQDDVRKYVPELPDYGNKITIDQLLTHTSGLKDWRNVNYITPYNTGSKLFTQHEVIDFIAKQSNLNYKPGERYSYTNAGHDLVATIIERITKKKFRDFVSEELLVPAGMTHSFFVNRYTDVIPKVATGYSGTPDQYRVAFILDETYGAAGLWTTADDLRKWNQFVNGALGEKLKDIRLKHYVLNSGKPITYTNGGVIERVIEGVTEITHSGFLGGFRSVSAYYPEHKISFTYMSNTSHVASTEVHAAVFEVLFGKKYNQPIPEAKSIALSDEHLNKFKGQYYNPEDLSEWLTFSVQNNTLINYEAKLATITDHSFLFEKTVYNYSTTGDTLNMIRSGAPSTFLRAKDFKPSAKELATFTGEFYCADADMTYQFKEENGKLMVYKTARDSFAIVPAYQLGNEYAFRGFINGLRAVFIFTKPKSGPIKNIMVHLPRANNIPFTRTK